MLGLGDTEGAERLMGVTNIQADLEQMAGLPPGPNPRLFNDRFGNPNRFRPSRTALTERLARDMAASSACYAASSASLVNGELDGFTALRGI